MAPSTKKAGKKEKVFHPSSRKARQLNRKVVRSEKLRSLRKERIEKQGNDGLCLHSLSNTHLYLVYTANIYAFFYHLLPEEGALTLEELHELVRDVWLVRREEELAAEIAARRPGRPKSKRQIELEDEKAREWEEYRTGLGASSRHSLAARGSSARRSHRLDS